MSTRSWLIPEPIYPYYQSVGLREPPVLAELSELTGKHPQGGMQISAEQGQFMQLLVRAIGAKKCLEVGVFTGYSSLSVALAIPDDGRIVACDVSAEYTDIAHRFWEKAGVAHKIDLRIAPGCETLDKLIAGGESGTFDFAFIDADKENYGAYYERACALVRRGGLIAVDNTLWAGRLVDASDQRPATVAMREFNVKVHRDARVMLSMLPIGDGLTLALKL
jgi:caffeoyl-CoA O-methyltransferase